MNVRQSVLGEVAIRSGQQLSGVDIGSLIRRLVLFDRVVVKSFRLREIPALVRAFGKAGFSQLVESGLLQFSCEFTGLIVDISRDGIRHVPLNHFSFGTFDAADRDGALKAELRCLQSIGGLKNPERASLEEVIWKSLVRPPTTYAKDLLDQIDHDLRTNTPALKAAVIERLRVELQTSDLPVADIPIEVEETTNRIFHVKNTLAETFKFSHENVHLVLQKAVSAVANLDHRLADMQAYSAITGFLDGESPLLFGKLAGIIAPLNPKLVEQQFERVVELASIPDFKHGQKVDVEKLIQIRETAECREFRAWLTTLDDVSVEITEMVASIKNKMASLANSVSGKLVRLAATTGIGLIPVVGPITGAVAGVIDSFLIDKVLPQSGVVAFLTETYPSLFVSA